jgi:hemerythrin
MRSLQWTEEHSVFLPEIDVEHQQVFRDAVELRQAVLAGETAERLEPLVDRLECEVTGHFLHEERLMQTAGYPAITWHLRQHETARARLALLRRRIRHGDRESIFQSLESIAGWLRDHTTVADRMVGSFLRNYRRTRPSG